MDFRRIDKNTVQCILSEAEMQAYGFKIEDFFSDKEKSRNFLEHIVERAEEEVGYEAKSGMISMQIMKMPNNDLAITFTDREKADGIQNMLQHIQQLASIISDEDSGGSQQPSEEDAEAQNAAALEFTDAETVREYRKHLEEVRKKKREKELKLLNAPRAYRIERFEQVECLAGMVPLDKPITSSLYKDMDTGEYYLLIKKGRLKREEYQKLCETVSEFAVFCSCQPYIEQYCREHFDTIIAKQAIGVLRDIQAGTRGR